MQSLRSREGAKYANVCAEYSLFSFAGKMQFVDDIYEVLLGSGASSEGDVITLPVYFLSCFPKYEAINLFVARINCLCQFFKGDVVPRVD